MFTWDFISSKMKCFQCGVWSISYNNLHDTTRNETHCRCFFHCDHIDKNEISFRVIKMSCKSYPKWNHMKGNICKCVNKNDCLLLNGPFTRTTLKSKFISFCRQWKVLQIEFILRCVEISFRVDFILGLMKTSSKRKKILANSKAELKVL